MVKQVIGGDKKDLVKRIDYSTEKDATREYITEFHLVIVLDKDGNLL